MATRIQGLSRAIRQSIGSPNPRLDPTWGRVRLALDSRRLYVAAGRRPSSLAAPHPVPSFRWAPRGSSAARSADQDEMDETEICEFARSELERIDSPYGGPAYRCSVVLKDGLTLPCVLLAGIDSVVELAQRRFRESLADSRLPKTQQRFGRGMRYKDIVRTFVASGNRVNSYDIAKLDKSRYAIPLCCLRDVKGETTMSWTQFTGVMRDGREFAFGTQFLMEFFEMPEGYSGEDIAKVVSHKGGDPIHRERPYFTCFVNGL
jgi:hypothetical protein